jgi:CRP-like cAMP-binding protein
MGLTIMSAIITCDPRENQLLCALTDSELELLVPHLELVTMSASEVLFEAYEKLHHIYFPTTSTVSLLCCLEDGVTVEVAMIGNEGMLGVSALMGRNEAPTQALVNQAGYGYRISINSIQSVLARNGGRRLGVLQKTILRFAQTLFIQVSQTTACNRRHTLDQQLCSWLLSCFDRGRSNNLSMTQESIAYILGVRRESITQAAKNLQEAGIINYQRGHIELKSRASLESSACECYKVLKRESNQLSADLKAA